MYTVFCPFFMQIFGIPSKSSFLYRALIIAVITASPSPMHTISISVFLNNNSLAVHREPPAIITEDGLYFLITLDSHLQYLYAVTIPPIPNSLYFPLFFFNKSIISASLYLFSLISRTSTSHCAFPSIAPIYPKPMGYAPSAG